MCDLDQTSHLFFSLILLVFGLILSLVTLGLVVRSLVEVVAACSVVAVAVAGVVVQGLGGGFRVDFLNDKREPLTNAF